MDYNDKLEALEREQSELRQMIGEGITFDVEVTYTRRKPGLLGFFRKREKITERKYSGFKSLRWQRLTDLARFGCKCR